MTVSEQIARFHGWAVQALGHYGLTAPEVTFLRRNENLTFHVRDHARHAAYLLRLHKPSSPNYSGVRQHPTALASELLWLDALRQDTRLTVQQPVRTVEGTLGAVLDADGETLPCTLLRWIEGEQPSFDGPEGAALARRLGEVVARLHTHAEHWAPPVGFVRPVYDAPYFTRQVSLLSPGVVAGLLSEHDHAAIQDTVAHIVALLTSLPLTPEHWGLIHNDVQGSNILTWRGDVRLIDFSLCGFSYYLSDLGTTLPGLTRELRPAFLAGYQAHRPLTDRPARLVDGFFVLSRLGCAGWLGHLLAQRRHNHPTEAA